VKIEEVFQKAKDLVKARTGRSAEKIGLVRNCPVIEKDHKEDARVYAHAFHRKNRICVCRAIDKLSTGHKLGIMLHELGHAFGRQHDEPGADLWVEEKLGVDLEYRKLVQWAPPGLIGAGGK
jgi:hypothetical protein